MQGMNDAGRRAASLPILLCHGTGTFIAHFQNISLKVQQTFTVLAHINFSERKYMKDLSGSLLM